MAVVAAEPSAPPAAEERLAEEPPSTAAPPWGAPWWRLRKRAIKRRPEPVSVPEPEPELQASQDASEPTPLAEEPPAPGRRSYRVRAARSCGCWKRTMLSTRRAEPLRPVPRPASPEPGSSGQERIRYPRRLAEEPSGHYLAYCEEAAAEEPLTAPVVEEAAAEKPPDAPLPEEPPAVAAEVEPAVAQADGEEPTAAAAETGDQPSPEPAPVPEREPEHRCIRAHAAR